MRAVIHGIITKNAWQSPAVARQAHQTPHAQRRPAKTPLTSDGLVAFAACATLSATTAFHAVNTAGAFGVHNAFLFLVTLTFDL